MSEFMTIVDATTSTTSGMKAKDGRSPYRAPGPFQKAVLIGVGVAVLGTSSVTAAGSSPTCLFADGSTHAGHVVVQPRPAHPGTATAAQIAEVKHISGLTWDQVARMFGVDRRSVHYWIQGATMNAANTENLGLVLEQVRQIASACGGAPEIVRDVLLRIGSDGQPLLHRIVERSGGKLPASADMPKPVKMVDLGLERRPPLVPEMNVADRLSSSSEGVPEARGRRLGRIQVKRKPKE